MSRLHSLEYPSTITDNVWARSKCYRQAAGYVECTLENPPANNGPPPAAFVGIVRRRTSQPQTLCWHDKNRSVGAGPSTYGVKTQMPCNDNIIRRVGQNEPKSGTSAGKRGSLWPLNSAVRFSVYSRCSPLSRPLDHYTRKYLVFNRSSMEGQKATNIERSKTRFHNVSFAATNILSRHTALCYIQIIPRGQNWKHSIRQICDSTTRESSYQDNGRKGWFEGTHSPTNETEVLVSSWYEGAVCLMAELWIGLSRNLLL